MHGSADLGGAPSELRCRQPDPGGPIQLRLWERERERSARVRLYSPTQTRQGPTHPQLQPELRLGKRTLLLRRRYH
uniref:Uncharacterized protein n=1 Tax=Hyaloperonospora arabidopsidis (strain Emoy2) TaxID=559515 RepID=M4BG52_HYAAE